MIAKIQKIFDDRMAELKREFINNGMTGSDYQQRCEEIQYLRAEINKLYLAPSPPKNPLDISGQFAPIEREQVDKRAAGRTVSHAGG